MIPLRTPLRSLFTLALAAACTSASQQQAAAPTPAGQPAADNSLIARARAIHQRVMTLDTHVDIDPRNFTTEHPNYTDRLNTQVNLPKMFDGGLDAVFFSIFVGQGPLTPEGYQRAYNADQDAGLFPSSDSATHIVVGKVLGDGEHVGVSTTTST